jgi:hypothetical protein
MTASRPKETELYTPVRAYLEAQCYDVRSEVKGCDITATRGEDLLIVELKTAFSTTLLIQATERQRFADSVYVALPRPASGQMRGSHWRGVERLLKRLELGLIFVSWRDDVPWVEVVFHPEEHERRNSPKRRRAVIREINGRSGEYNQGGSNTHEHRILTAYREAVLLVAVALDEFGPSAPKDLAARGTGPKTGTIVRFNNYGWFERVARGVYALCAEGRAALEQYPDLVAHYRRTLRGGENKTSEVSQTSEV